MKQSNFSVISRNIDIPRKVWETFLENHPGTNVFHSPDFYDAMENTPRYDPFVLAAFDDERMVGVVAGIVQKEINGGLGYLTSRAIIMGGPLIMDNDLQILQVLLKYYSTHFRKHALYTQIRNMHDMAWARRVLEENGFVYDDHLDILIALNVGKEELLSGMHRSRRRNVTKALNKGVEMVEIESADQLEKGFVLIKETYERVKLPCPDRKMFDVALNYLAPQNQLKGFLAVCDGKVIGIRLVLTYNNLIYDWYAGSSFEERNKYPNDFLIYHILLWGQENGFEIFDFGGAGHPDEEYGVREHKLKFGGELVNFGRFQKVHSPLLYTIISRSFKAWRKLKGADG